MLFSTLLSLLSQSILYIMFPLLLFMPGYIILALATKRKEYFSTSARVVGSIVVSTFLLIIPSIILGNTIGVINLYFKAYTILVTVLSLTYLTMKMHAYMHSFNALLGRIKIVVHDTFLLLAIIIVALTLVKYTYVSLVRPIIGADSLVGVLPTGRAIFALNTIPHENPYNLVRVMSPPAFSILAAWTYAVSGDLCSEFFRLIPLIYYVGMVFVIYEVAKENYNNRVASIAVSVFCLLPFFDFTFYMQALYPDTFVAFFSFVAIYYFWKFIQNENSFWLAISGLSASLSVVGKFQGMFQMLFLLLLLIIKIPRRFVHSILSAAFLFLLFYFYNPSLTFTKSTLVELLSLILLFLILNFTKINRSGIKFNWKNIILFSTPFALALTWYLRKEVFVSVFMPTWPIRDLEWALHFSSFLSEFNPWIHAYPIHLSFLAPLVFPLFGASLWYYKAKGLFSAVSRGNEFSSIIVALFLYNIYMFIGPLGSPLAPREFIYVLIPLVLLISLAMSSLNSKDKMIALSLIAIFCIFTSHYTFKILSITNPDLLHSVGPLYIYNLNDFQFSRNLDFIVWYAFLAALPFIAIDIYRKLQLRKHTVKLHTQNLQSGLRRLLLPTVFIILVLSFNMKSVVSYTLSRGEGNLQEYRTREAQDFSFYFPYQTLQSFPHNPEDSIITVGGGKFTYYLNMPVIELSSPQVLEKFYDIFHQNNATRVLALLNKYNVKYFVVPTMENSYYYKLYTRISNQTRLFTMLGNNFYFKHVTTSQWWSIYSTLNLSKPYYGFTLIQLIGKSKELNVLLPQTYENIVFDAPSDHSVMLAFELDTSGLEPKAGVFYTLQLTFDAALKTKTGRTYNAINYTVSNNFLSGITGFTLIKISPITTIEELFGTEPNEVESLKLNIRNIRARAIMQAENDMKILYTRAKPLRFFELTFLPKTCTWTLEEGSTGFHVDALEVN